MNTWIDVVSGCTCKDLFQLNPILREKYLLMIYKRCSFYYIDIYGVDSSNQSMKLEVAD